MIFVKLDENNNITEANYDPFHPIHGEKMTEEEMLKVGLLLPEPNYEGKAGHIGRLKYNPELNKLYFEYVPRALEPIEKIQQLETDLGQILMESAADKAKITELEKAQGDLLMELATLKMGGSA
ncbi:hypothetical protein [Bacillus cereus]|uniref:hypothetical protein n=1 Tax=Bacillaceae TaxID=186817 RepID=UPI0037FA96E7